MRIVHISDNLPPHHKGGAEVSCAAVMRGLRRRGHDVFAITNTTGSRPTTQEGTFTVDTSCYWGCRDTRVLLDNYEQLRRRVFDLSPDVVHVHTFEDRLHGALRLALDFPTVYTAHNYMLEVAHGLRASYFVHRPASLLSKQSLIFAKHLLWQDRRYLEMMCVEPVRWLRRIVCPSLFMKRQIETLVGPERAALIYNGVEDVYSDAVPLNDPSSMVFVGRLDRIKGVDYIVEAAALLRRSGHPTEVTFIGDGRDASRLRAAIRRHKLDDAVNLLPPVSRVDHTSYRGIVVYPSVWAENCSMTILEALSAGKVVICTGQGGNAELVSHLRDALVVQPRNARAIADEILRLRKHPELLDQLSRNARETFRTRFTLDRQVEQLELLYSEVLEAPARSWQLDRPPLMTAEASVEVR